MSIVRTRDITTKMVLEAIEQYHNLSSIPYIDIKLLKGKAPYEYLMFQTGACMKVVFSALNREDEKGLTDYGFNAGYPFLTDEGRKRLKELDNNDSLNVEAS